MSEEIVQSGSDVTSDASSAPSETASSESASADSAKAASAEQQPKTNNEQYVPYDRFKELVEQKNQFVRQYEEQQKALKDLQAKYQAFESASKPKELSPSQKMIQTLKERGVEAEFIQHLERQENALSELEQLKQWRAQADRQNYISSAQSIVSKLQSELKVDPVLHKSYLHQIREGIPLDQIEATYKSLHDGMNKFLEAQKRSILAEYTAAKKTDAKVPAPTKATSAKPATAAKKQGFSKDPEAARREFAKELANSMRASKNM